MIDAKPAKYTMTTVNSQQQKAGYEVRLDIESVSSSEKFQLEGVLKPCFHLVVSCRWHDKR